MNVKSQEPKKDYLQDDLERKTEPKPIIEDMSYEGSNKLLNKNVLIIGGDSGIGKSVAILFAKEGANIYFTYYENEHEDALITEQRIKELNRPVKKFQGDADDESFVEYLSETLPNIDVFIYNAAEQHYTEDLLSIKRTQVQRVFETNVFAALTHVQYLYDLLNENANIIFTTSVTAFKGNPELLEYAASKGALTTLMRSLSQHKQIKDKGIRVNAVAPGPVWTPLIPATIPNYDENWGDSGPLDTYCQPVDVAPTYLYLALDNAQYITGQTIHVNGLETT